MMTFTEAWSAADAGTLGRREAVMLRIFCENTLAPPSRIEESWVRFATNIGFGRPECSWDGPPEQIGNWLASQKPLADL